MKINICILAILIVLCTFISGHAVPKGSHETKAVYQSGAASVESGYLETAEEIEDSKLQSFKDKMLRYYKDWPKPSKSNEPSPKDRPLSPKEVFLTFDDGPSPNTEKILKILNDNGVKASFFVLGSCAERYPDMVKAEYEGGMAILNHSYSHNYSMYKSLEGCTEDFNRGRDVLKSILGIEPLSFIRFPGGSDNRVSNSNTMKNIRDTLAGKGIDYVDWNVSSEDASAAKVPADKIRSSTISQLSHRNFAVILMHDAGGKTTTVEALPSIIDYLKTQGFVFRTFSDITTAEYNEMLKDKIIDRGAATK
ncbi:MAG: polysaccharide deacetylase family protein [Bacillota bacterium]|nr:polysaccharide deacetylase family protein [Bacillota bacterium]